MSEQVAGVVSQATNNIQLKGPGASFVWLSLAVGQN